LWAKCREFKSLIGEESKNNFHSDLNEESNSLNVLISGMKVM
jgi:hypothetical protein